MATHKMCKFCNKIKIIWKSTLKTYVDADDLSHKHMCDEMAEAYRNSIKPTEEEVTKSQQHDDNKVDVETH